MIRFLLLRTAWTIPILLGVTVVVFITVQLVPGDAVDALLGSNATEAAREALRARLGLDRSLFEQYFFWLGHAATGDLGTSVAHQAPALDIVASAFRNTLILAGAAAVIAVVLGLLLGAAAGFSKSRAVKAIVDSIGLLFVSMPAYTFGIILIVYLAVAMALFPASGMAREGATVLDQLRYLFLPALTAAIVPAGLIARVFRTSIEDLRAQEFIEAYRARGVARWKISLHVMHNAVPTMLTVAGLQIGYLLSGVVFVETVFAWPGLGQLVYQSIAKRDLAVIQAGVLISAFAFVLINLLVDVLRAVVDPRIRSS